MKSHQKPQQLHFSHHESIVHKVKHLDEMNKQLLSISSQLENTSFLHQNKSGYKSMVGEFQKQMKQTLQAIIDNIKQFFIDIDKKLKNVALAVCEEGNNKEKQDFKYSILFDKVKNLEYSLKKTQQHETKLLEIIQTMMQKYQITDEPTLLRNEPLMRDRQRTTSTQNLIHGSQKLRSPFLEENQKMQKSFHENLYLMDESIVSSSLKSLRINDEQKEPEQDVFIKKLYSKATIPCEQKKSLRTEKQIMCGSTNKISFMKAGKDQSQFFEDKKHRMNYMMDKLQK